jgi:hypothetical protein
MRIHRCEDYMRDLEYFKREYRVKKLLEERKKLKRLAKKYDISYINLLTFRKNVSKKYYYSVLSLFNTNIKSGFKISLRNQVILWFQGKTKYSSPLTDNQMRWL